VAVLAPDLVYTDGAFHGDRALAYSAETGRIERIGPIAEVSDVVTRLPGRALLPGFVNAHSHAFQRLIRGRTQWRVPGAAHADFWSWRSAMYHAVIDLEPEDVSAVSRFCFVEMLRAGYTAVGEFHYLHRDPRGDAYADASELARRVVAAAEDVGIRIRLLHVAYVTGGIGEPLLPEQRRFATPSLDGFMADVAALAAWSAQRPLVEIGVAPHSVRAVPADWLAPIHTFARDHDLPLHIHASEQPAEVSACAAAYARRPIELLAEHGLLDERTTIVHGTHVTPREIALLAAAAAVCACPTTERDLGDGFLAAEELRAAGVRIALGSDSQTIIDPLEEMRLLEYHERLRKLRRVVLAGDAHDGQGGVQVRIETAPVLLEMATRAGARSLRLDTGELVAGAGADFVAVDLTHPALEGWNAYTLPAMLALCAPPDVITDVWVAGVQRIGQRRHAAEEEAATAFREISRRLA
jgi:formimidoylglutamate deiminase